MQEQRIRPTYRSCRLCSVKFSLEHLPVSLVCGHTWCRNCLLTHRGPCPIDQAEIRMNIQCAPVNMGLLKLVDRELPAMPYRPPEVIAMPEIEQRAYDSCMQSIQYLALYLTDSENVPDCEPSKKYMSGSLMRKLGTLVQCTCTESVSRQRAYCTVWDMAERTLLEMIQYEQANNIVPHELGNHLWAAVRNRGCQFLGPTIQEEILKLILLALENCSGLSRKVLISYVVQRLQPQFSAVSKTSVGRVVQLLYRASCFHVIRRDRKSSLMQLKEELLQYEALRLEHDKQVVQIATEASLQLSPEQWSHMLYGDNSMKPYMQSIVDRLMVTYSFSDMANDFKGLLQKTRDLGNFTSIMDDICLLANLDKQPDKDVRLSQLSMMLNALKNVIKGLIRARRLVTLNSDRYEGAPQDMMAEMIGARAVPPPGPRGQRRPPTPRDLMPPLPSQSPPSLLFPPITLPAPLVGRPLQRAAHPQEPNWFLQHDEQANCLIQPDTSHVQEFERSDSLLATDSESVTQESGDNRYGPIAPITSRYPLSPPQYHDDSFHADHARASSSNRYMTPPSEEGNYMYGHISPLSLAQIELANMHITPLEPAQIQGAQRELHRHTQALPDQQVNQQEVYQNILIQARITYSQVSEPQQSYHNAYRHYNPPPPSDSVPSRRHFTPIMYPPPPMTLATATREDLLSIGISPTNLPPP